MDRLVEQIAAAFGVSPPPSKVVIFDDPDEREYYRDWHTPFWNQLEPKDADVYTYMSPAGKVYYLPGLMTQLLRGGRPAPAHHQMIDDLAPPDYPGSQNALWHDLLELPQDQFCAISRALPILESILWPGDPLPAAKQPFGRTTAEHSSEETFARRRHEYWNGASCDDSG